MNGNRRIANEPTGFYAVWKSVLPYENFWAHHVVEKGKWLPHEKWYFAKADVGCDFTRRGTLSWSQAIFYQVVQASVRLLAFLPWRFQVQIKNGLRRILRPVFRQRFERLRSPPKQPDPP